MPKSKEMEDVLDKISQAMFGRSRTDNVCVMCGSDKVYADDFNDDLSRKEFTISHMCQKCQDKVFSEPEEDERGKVL